MCKSNGSTVKQSLPSHFPRTHSQRSFFTRGRRKVVIVKILFFKKNNAGYVRGIPMLTQITTIQCSRRYKSALGFGLQTASQTHMKENKKHVIPFIFTQV